MPKQHVFFGRPVPRLPARRISLLLASISIFAVLTLIVTLPSAIPTGPSLSKFTDHKFSIPKFKPGPSWSSVFNPFRQPSHPPPRQRNDTFGESSWYANWKWLSIPFSSSITLDENRSLLPPLRDRPPIYCYYDANKHAKDDADKEAESALLLTWRRAWWAQGFKPVILSAAEAMNNPVYEELQRVEMDAATKADMMRWLAWENMGGGLLAHYLLLPMGPFADPLLSYLRRGNYPSLTRWDGLEGGLFAGPKADISAAIKLVMGSPELRAAKDFVEALPVNAEEDPFKLDDVPESLAYYSAQVLEKKYAKVAEAISTDRAKGLRSLNQLVNAHLHVTWQNSFPDGIAVLKPLPKHTTHMIDRAFELADRLSQCNESPLPSSCPPNLPRCSPCVAKQPMRITTPPYYRNNSALYTIGTVPHPYTFQLLSNFRDGIDVRWVRRDSKRDAWLATITKELLGTGISGAPRVLRFKEAVASDLAAASSLWLPAEDPPPADPEWRLGFAVPNPGVAGGALDRGHAVPPVPGPERRPQPPHDPRDGPVAPADELRREPGLLERARRVVVAARKGEGKVVRDAVEAWNLADTEAWRFARAFLARAHVERLGWEKEEARYADGIGTDKGVAASRESGWGRWLDRSV